MFTSIVVGTDGSDTARLAVDKATELAKACGAKVHLVSAYRQISQAMALSLGDAAMLTETASDEEIAAHTASMLSALADDIRQEGVDVAIYPCPGNAAEAVLDIADDQGADLIVVGSRGMRGARRVLGSVPNSVSHHAGCSVLIVHTA